MFITNTSPFFSPRPIDPCVSIIIWLSILILCGGEKKKKLPIWTNEDAITERATVFYGISLILIKNGQPSHYIPVGSRQLGIGDPCI